MLNKLRKSNVQKGLNKIYLFHLNLMDILVVNCASDTITRQNILMFRTTPSCLELNNALLETTVTIIIFRHPP